MENKKPASIDAYIATFPIEVQAILESLRAAIRAVAPDAIEAIAYQMPTFKLKGKNLAHFAAYKHHIGFYPTPVPIEHFSVELSPYKTSKGAIQFPIDQPIPFDLITRIVAHREKEIMEN